jgi:hypothetical protein
MFIIYDCSACFLRPLIGGMLLFTAGVMCVMLMEARRHRVAEVARTNTARHMTGGKMDG